MISDEFSTAAAHERPIGQVVDPRFSNIGRAQSFAQTRLPGRLFRQPMDD